MVKKGGKRKEKGTEAVQLAEEPMLSRKEFIDVVCLQVGLDDGRAAVAPPGRAPSLKAKGMPDGTKAPGKVRLPRIPDE